jgi:serine/threonine protein kinase
MEISRVNKSQALLLKNFENEFYVLDRITVGISSAHMAKLLTTYETPIDATRSKYHMIFEASHGTIATLWMDVDIWNRHHRNPELPLWVLLQCYGLADGLQQFHKFTNRLPEDMNDKTRGTHGDIKPENILWYTNWKQPADSDLRNHTFGEISSWILQLADFGLGSFHTTGSVKYVAIVEGAQDYLAPETEAWHEHPPAADIWQFGCLFLDFLVWLVEGPRGLETFEKERYTRGLVTEKRYRFSTIAPIHQDIRRRVGPQTKASSNSEEKSSITVSRPVMKVGTLTRVPSRRAELGTISDYLASAHLEALQEREKLPICARAGRPGAEQYACCSAAASTSRDGRVQTWPTGHRADDGR